MFVEWEWHLWWGGGQFETPLEGKLAKLGDLVVMDIMDMMVEAAAII